MIRTQKLASKLLADGKSRAALRSLLTAVSIFVLLASLISCQSTSAATQDKLKVVTYQQFEEFVRQTGYITDAEKYGWSIVQQDVYNYIKVKGANWRKPDGSHPPISVDLPVTQVSFNDASAYCAWAGVRLPSYEEYWSITKGDDRKIMSNNNGPISKPSQVNIIGNVWEITATEKSGNIRLAGGSVFCSPKTCHGTTEERELYIDKETGNIHISFAVLK